MHIWRGTMCRQLPDPHHISAAEQEQLQCTQQTNVHTWAALSPLLSHLTEADEASTLCTFASRMSDMWPLNCKRGKICSVAGSL